MIDSSDTYYSIDKPHFQIYYSDTSVSYAQKDAHFYGEVPDSDFQKIQKEKLHEGWYFFVFLSILFLFIAIKVFFGKRIQWIYRSIYNKRTTEKLIRDINPTSDQHSILLFLNFLLMGGFFIFKFKVMYQIQVFNLNGFSEYAFSVGLLLIYILFYEILVWMLGLITDQIKSVKLFIFNIRTVYYSLGILLIPINIFLIYQYLVPEKIVLYLGLLLLFSAILLKIAKGFQILVQNKVFLFYQFLYLCTLEILPFILFYNFYKGVINS